MTRWPVSLDGWHNGYPISSGWYHGIILYYEPMESEMNTTELAKAIYNPMFADRDNLKDAFDYALKLAEHSGNPPAVLTALFVVLNTVSKELKNV